MTYINTIGESVDAARTVTWQVNDGAGVNNLSAPVTSTINVVAGQRRAGRSPTASRSPTPRTIRPPSINSVITVSDVDSPNLTGATVQITGNYVSGQDVLVVHAASGITGSSTPAPAR